MNAAEKIDIITSAVESRASSLCELSDRLWEYAETAYVEFKSADALCEALSKEGFTVERNVTGIKTAFTGTYGFGKPVIGILGEFDALFNLSQKSGIAEKDPLISGGNGHGCGHNLFGAGSLAAAIAVKEYIKKTGCSGTVIYYGTPGEEGGSGKTFMARDGAFDRLDAAVTWHPGCENYVCTTTNLANIQAKFTFKGIASHAAADPERGRSALDALELMNVGVNFMREHISSDARVHYSITDSGGRSPNVVQPQAAAIYLCRSPLLKDVRRIYDWVCDIAKGAALMTQTTVEIDFMKAASNRIPNKVLEKVMYKNLCAFPLPTQTQKDIETAKTFISTYDVNYDSFEKKYSKQGDACLKAYIENVSEPLYSYVSPLADKTTLNYSSSDVSDVTWVCPTIQITAATESFGTPPHSWQRVAQGKLPFAHKGMLFAGKVMAGAVIDLMTDPETLEKAKAEHRERVGKEGYVCPIPKGVIPRPL